MKGVLTENLGLKLTSLLLAILLELYFYSPDNSITEDIDVGIELRNLPQSMMVVRPSDRRSIRTELKVKGPSPLVEEVKSNLGRVVVDLPSPLPSTFTFSPRDYIRLPSGVDLLSVAPAQIQLAFERLVRKELLVVVNRSGEPAPGYRIEDVVVRPDSVVATGPHTELEGMAAVETEQLDITGINRTRRYEVGITGDTKLTTLGVNFVSVIVKVMPVMEERVLKGVTVKVLAPEGFAASVEPSKVDVAVNGSVLALEQLNELPVTVNADARGLKEGAHRLSVSGAFPEGVSIVNTLPGKVTVTLVAPKPEPTPEPQEKPQNEQEVGARNG